MKTLALTTMITLLASPYAVAQEDADATPAAKPCPKTAASTIFIDDKTGSRQKGSAERLSEAHKSAQDQGWDFKDLEIYIEDGDLQGFFVTYVKPHPCNG